MGEKTLIFGLEESVRKLGETESYFDQGNGKKTCLSDWLENRDNYVNKYARVMGIIVTSDGFTFDKLNNITGYYGVYTDWYDLMLDYYNRIKKEDSPVRTVLKNLSKEQLKNEELLTSMSRENPFIEPFQQMGIEIVKDKENVQLWVVLDGLDVNKAATDKDALYHSTLHQIHEAWHNLKDKTIFLKDDKKVQAPWDKNPELWKQPKRTLETQKDSLNCQTSSLKTLEGLKKNAASQNINIKKQVPKKEKSTETSHSR